MKLKLSILLLLFSGSVFSQIEPFPTADAQECRSFYLLPGETYIISAWVKEIHPEQQKTYTNGLIRINFYKDHEVLSTGEALEFYGSGTIIEGWQRIIGIIAVPTTINDETPRKMAIELANLSSSIDCYFDDVRVFPYNGTLKSFVYDEGTQRLVAELDENNYATFYEYDNEGGLIRVKKETESGIYTIQETRSSTKKDN